MGQGSRKSAQKSSFKRLSILLHKTLDKLLEKLDVAVFLLWVSVAFDRLLYLLVREQHFCRCFAAFLLVPFLARFPVIIVVLFILFQRLLAVMPLLCFFIVLRNSEMTLVMLCIFMLWSAFRRAI